ncbi:hypothetical protein QUA35_30100 [Microcoleus sp. N9_B2]
MNSLLLISSYKGSGFKPILSGKQSINCAVTEAQEVKKPSLFVDTLLTN